MKHARILPNFKTLLMAVSLFAITLPLANGCKTTSKTTGSSSNMNKKSESFSDTAAVPKNDTGKQTNNGKDKPPRK